MTRFYFLSFGNEAYHSSLQRIKEQAKSFNMFNDLFIYKEDDLRTIPEFWNEHHGWINSKKRGHGYWIWKSFLTKYVMEKYMEDNDILVYADAGCSLNIHGKTRLFEYIDIVNNSDYGILSFSMDHLPEKSWTKMDLFRHLNATEDVYMNSGQIIATSFVLRKCGHTKFIIDLWYETACNYHLLDDSASNSKNDDSFKEHRHDQSIFSLIRKVYGTEILTDETFFWNWNEGYPFPILATRRGNLPFL
jgi:hypothetical protein